MLKVMRKKSFWMSLVFILLVMFVIRYSTLNRTEISFAEKLVGDIYAPFQNGLTDLKTWTNRFGLGIADKKVLGNRVETLQTQNNSLMLENQQLREYRAEALRLRELLAYRDAQKDEYTMEAARVIARNANNWYQMLTIDKGTLSGIEQGMSVVSPEGMVGRVISASKNSAQVSLITDRSMAVGVILQETRDTRGIAEGIGDSETLCMMNIPYYAKIRNGQKVVTSGLSETYPKGILLGSVRSVKREENGLVLTAVITPAVKFDKLEEVLVITSFQPQEEDLNGGE